MRLILFFAAVALYVVYYKVTAKPTDPNSPNYAH